MSIQDTKELSKFLHRKGPNPKDVIQVAQVHERQGWTFREDGMLPLHSCLRQHLFGELLPHGRPVHLEVVFSIECEVIVA